MKTSTKNRHAKNKKIKEVALSNIWHIEVERLLQQNTMIKEDITEVKMAWFLIKELGDYLVKYTSNEGYIKYEYLEFKELFKEQIKTIDKFISKLDKVVKK